jgi:2-polyprenyl-3-methyl-5-hydroxy-6-metoxy-1,4-benzoquinol methylase
MKIKQKIKTLLRPCPICNCGQGKILHTQRFIVPQDYVLPTEYDVVVCRDCGFVYADTPAKQASYDQFYALQSKYEDKNTGSGGGYTSYDKKRINDTADEIARQCLDKNARIIDIGCANGGLLRALKERGFTNLFGYDPSQKCVEDVRLCDIKCFQGSIFEAPEKLQGQHFDFLILSHVMEHIYDLKLAVEICNNLLNDSGKMYIEVPDASRYDKFYVVPYYYFDTEHINHFDKISLINLGISNGFVKLFSGHKVMTVSENTLYPALYVLFNKAESLKALHFASKARQSVTKYIQLSTHNSLNAVVSKFVETQEEILVFGAGNFTCRLLATTDLAKCNIIGFLDNDTNKHTSANDGLLGKSVQSPNILTDVEATVVICSAVFADEIQKQVLTINNKLKVVIIK